MKNYLILKICQYGVIQFEFNSNKNEGFVGLAFLYKDKENYYSFEVGGGENKYCSIKKTIKNLVYVISENKKENCGFSKGKWFKYYIQIMEKEIIVYVEKENKYMQQIMSINNLEDINEGYKIDNFDF